jgi:hypothetical protein
LGSVHRVQELKIDSVGYTEKLHVMCSKRVRILISPDDAENIISGTLLFSNPNETKDVGNMAVT